MLGFWRLFSLFLFFTENTEVNAFLHQKDLEISEI